MYRQSLARPSEVSCLIFLPLDNGVQELVLLPEGAGGCGVLGEADRGARGLGLVTGHVGGGRGEVASVTVTGHRARAQGVTCLPNRATWHVTRITGPGGEGGAVGGVVATVTVGGCVGQVGVVAVLAWHVTHGGVVWRHRGHRGDGGVGGSGEDYMLMPNTVHGTKEWSGRAKVAACSN